MPRPVIKLLVGLAGAVLVALSACSGNGQGTPVERPPEQDVGGASAPPRAWRPLPPSPLTGRWDATALWTGSEVVLWGGFASVSEALVDGASYHPERRTWTPIPPAPVPARGHQVAHWIDDRLVVWVDAWSPTLVAGAVYAPGDERWLPVASPPAELSIGGPSIATDDLLFVLARSEHGSVSIVSYDPASDHWEALPRPPPAQDELFMIESGGDLYLWGCGGRYGAVWEGGREWRRVQPPPAVSAICITAPVFPGALATDHAVLVWPFRDEGPLAGARFDVASGEWTGIAPAPTDVFARAVAADGEVVVWGGGTYSDPACEEGVPTVTTDAGFVYSIERDSWRSIGEVPLGPRNGHAMVWTGRDVFIWGGADGGPAGTCLLFDDGATWEPVD